MPGNICKMAQQTICVDCIEMAPGCGCYPIEEPTCVPDHHNVQGNLPQLKTFNMFNACY